LIEIIGKTAATSITVPHTLFTFNIISKNAVYRKTTIFGYYLHLVTMLTILLNSANLKSLPPRRTKHLRLSEMLSSERGTKGVRAKLSEVS